MSFNDALLDSMLTLLRKRGFDEAVKVLSYKEEEESGGYCNTCYYEETVVYIYFEKYDGTTDSYRYYSDFASLIQELTTVEEGDDEW